MLELTDDNVEHGIGFDFDNKHTNIEGILVIRGEEWTTSVPGRSKIAESTVEQSLFGRHYEMHRDYEVVAHTHPPANDVYVKYPSPEDLYVFIDDADNLGREYNVIFLAGKIQYEI